MNELYFGIFWVISDDKNLKCYRLLFFSVKCDINRNPIDIPTISLDSKSGANYNHKGIWARQVKNNPIHKPYNKKDYSYYPRGRVEVSHNKAVIYLNPVINIPQIIDDIKAKFGLTENNISSVRVIADNSKHYSCFINSDFE